MNSVKKDVSRQSHYTRFKIQPLVFALLNHLGFAEGCIVKYVCRYPYKNGVEDLYKAKHYIEKLIEREETGTVTL